MARPAFRAGTYDIKIACVNTPGTVDFAGALLQLEWFHVSQIILGFPHLFRHLGVQRIGVFYYKNHHHNCDLISNQVC